MKNMGHPAPLISVKEHSAMCLYLYALCRAALTQVRLPRLTLPHMVFPLTETCKHTHAYISSYASRIIQKKAVSSSSAVLRGCLPPRAT